MFQKPAFGSNTSGFGSFSANPSTSSPFGFKPTAGTSAFGAPPAFGATTTSQPNTTGGLFGATNTTGGLFGNTAAPTSSAFGAPSTGFGFGASTSTGGLFSNNAAGGGLFGNTQHNSAFGAKPAGFGFGSTTTNATTGNLFGSTPATGTGLFGQQNTTMAPSGGLFSNTTSTFGQQQATGTGHVKYNPVTGTDVVVKNGASQTVNIKHHCITCMKEYENKCLEELRLEDYIAGRKGGSFTAFQQAENKPMFPATGFGQTATTSAPSVFGGGGMGTSTFGQTNTFSFGGNTSTNANTSNLFGANKPAFGATTAPGTGLFGATTTTQAPAFGTNTSAFGFGANTQNQQSTGMFGAKPATSFGNTGFGSFGSGGVFNKPASTAPTFPQQAQPFGTNTLGGFGTSTANTGGGLFGGSTFGKPNPVQPTLNLNPTPGLGTGLGGGLGTNTLQSKPGGFGTGSMFQQPQNNNTFSTGLNTGLGGGLFGNNSALGGGLGGMGGLGNNTSMLNQNQIGASATGNVHEQILTMAARPYGDWPLFKDLMPDKSVTAEDILKPTNPIAVKAALDKSQYKITSPGQALKLRPRALSDKKSLFDGLEESDASLDDKLSLKPSRKRLVLRPNQSYNRDSLEPQIENNNRSLEEQPQNNNNSNVQETTERDRNNQQNHAKERDGNSNNVNAVDKRRSNNFPDNFDASSDRHGSWLSSPPSMWNDKEKPIENEPTPRLYPNLEKELPPQVSERRASWLTTKPLRKSLSNNHEGAENSVRELGVRPSLDKQHSVDNLSACGGLHFCVHRSGTQQPGCSDCHKIQHQIAGCYVSEDDHVAPRDAPPHPTGVKLTRPGYYTIPSLDEMINYIRTDGRCVVPNLTIGRKNYGNVYYDCEIDVTGLDLDTLVHFLNKEVIIYPEDNDKPPIGVGLNRRAIVTLDRIWPRDKTDLRPITSPDRLMKMDYEGKLRRVCDKHDTKFIEYRPQTGSWVFRVEHFSKYGLTDSDEEDEITPEVIKKQLTTQQLASQQLANQPLANQQLVNQQLQKNASPGTQQPALAMLSRSLGGLGSLSSGWQSSPGFIPAADFNVNGSGKAFEMDTEDNTEVHSMYTDMERAFAVKSPTSELARLEHRESKNVQLMKASLYADTDMEDDISVSTTDQRVPTLGSVPTPPPQPIVVQDTSMEVQQNVVEQQELPMKPLILHPQTVVVQYHRKVPPFSQTIAGRVDAKFIADMSISRARHSRVGFGLGNAMAYVTTYDAVANLDKKAELCEVQPYLSGRSDDDWSQFVVNTLSINDNCSPDIFSAHLDALLKHSELVDTGKLCPLYTVKDRLSLLRDNVRIAEKNKEFTSNFGVSGSYCYEVWKLCEVLWEQDLENDGIQLNTEEAIVSRHKNFLQWLQDSVATITDEELARPAVVSEIDEFDHHSSQVLSLVMAGRIVEACKLCVKHQDYNLAALIAQQGSDPTFRSLLSRQLSQWQSLEPIHITPDRLRTLSDLCGVRRPTRTAYLLQMSVCVRYLCPQIPTLEQVVTTYEQLCKSENEKDVDIIALEDPMENYPSPPHLSYLENNWNVEGKPRRILDLRYLLIRSRALNLRPRLQAASYTPDPLDYSLCFLLSIWFGNPTAEIISSVASQLEANGLWHYAVLALCYMPDYELRSHLIKGVLSRHAPAKVETQDLEQRLNLIRKLGVPEKWLLMAQAYRAKYEHLDLLEAEYLVGAEEWNSAHKVLMDKLLPEVVLKDNLKSVSTLLEKLNEAANKDSVSGWETGGKALYYYCKICEEIRDLVNEAESSETSNENVNSRMMKLRPYIVACCNSLAHWTPKNVKHSAALAEMGSLIIRITAGAGMAASIPALTQLKLPPDVSALCQSQITKEIADQASELCIQQTVDCSPISSHRRSALQA